ncbi:hypothetical protein BGZ46_001298 [Entomortierella lignicola]|nr:hypothetical protein BGZ46_001298 [Entomortierella lignicola]
MIGFDIVNHPIKDTLLIVSSLLSLMVHKNDIRYNPAVDPITLFHSRAVPRISIESYLMRVLQFIPFTNEVLLNVLVYLDRIGGLSGMEMGPSGTVVGEVLDNKAVATPAKSVSLNPASVPDSTTSSSPSSHVPTSESVSYPLTEQTKPLSTVTTNEVSNPRSSESSPQQPCSISTTFPASHSPQNNVSTCINTPSVSSINSKEPKSSIRFGDTSTQSNLNSESPMVHKRGRDDENQESDMAQSNSSMSHYPQLQKDANICHTSKKKKLDSTSSTTSATTSPSSTLTQQQQQQSLVPETTRVETVIDVQNTPGGSTPAQTPKLSVASNGFRINSFNIHRLLITCIMVAAKFTSDHFYSNARYAKVGGLSLLELNQLELEFLFTTRFELNVKVEELQKVGNALLRYKNRELVSTQPTMQLQQQYNNTLSELQRANLHGNTINTSAALSNKDTQILQQKKGRFSIPSPTSPRAGPMSDKPPTTSSTSSLLAATNTTAAVLTTATGASFLSTSNNDQTTTVVVVSEERKQRPQLLSPPEEKHRWAESEGQMERVDQAQERNRSLSSQSSSG